MRFVKQLILNVLMYVCENKANKFRICAIMKMSLLPILNEVAIFVHDIF